MGLESVDSLVRRHAREVEGLKESHAAQFQRALEEARKTIEGRLAAAGDDPLTAFRLRSQIFEVEGAIKALRDKGTGILIAGEAKASSLSLEQLNRELRDLGGQFGDPIKVSLSAARELSDDIRGLLANQFETSMQRYGLDVLNKVRGRLISGVIAGDSPRDIAKEIAGRSGSLGEVTKVEADRLVRTEISTAYGHANTTAMKRAQKQIPDLKKTWIHVGSYDCPVCSALHGTTRPMDGAWTFKQGKRERTVAGPPAHPNCSCRAIPTRASWRKKLDELGYMDKSRRIDVAA